MSQAAMRRALSVSSEAKSPAPARAPRAVATPRPTAPKTPRVDLYQAAARGRVGPVLRGMPADRLAALAARTGAVLPEGATAAQMRKAVAAKAYDSVALSRTVAGYAPGTAQRAAAVLARVPVTAATESLVVQAAKSAIDVGKSGVIGLATGGVRGAVTGVATSLGGKGKFALGAAAIGFGAYEAREGYKLDGVKGAVYGVLDGALNIGSGGVLGSTPVSGPMGYDYGKARREAEAATKSAPPPTADPTVPAVPAGASEFLGRSPPAAPSSSVAAGLKFAGAGVAASVAGVGAEALGRRLAASSLPAVLRVATAAPLMAGGRLTAAAGAMAAMGGLFHAATRPASAAPMISGATASAPADGAFMNRAAQIAAQTAAAPRAPSAPIGASSPTGSAQRSSYTTVDGRTVEATEAQAKAWAGRRN
jgi:hypothetical protein